MSRIAITLRTLGQGGTDRVAVLLANGFAAAGHEVDIVIAAPGGKGAGVLGALVDPDVGTVVTGNGRGDRTGAVVAGFPGLLRYLRTRRPDVLLSNGNNMNWWTALAHWLVRSRARLCLKITNPLLRPHDSLLKRRYRRHLHRLAFGRAAVILPLSSADSDAVAALVPSARGKLRPAHNPHVPADALARPFVAGDGRGRRLVAIGRLSAQKNFGLLIDAMAEPIASGWRLTILGEGPDRLLLEERIAALGIADRVRLPGFVADVGLWLRDADLFVLSSRYEGLPAVVIEALAAGVRVVTTDCFASARSLVGELPGCAVVTSQDAPALAAAIAQALSKPDGRPERRAAASPYSFGNAVRDHLSAMGLA